MRDLWSGKGVGPEGPDDPAPDGDDLWSGRKPDVEEPSGRRRRAKRRPGRTATAGAARRPGGVSPRTRTTARVLLVVLIVGGPVLGGLVAWDLWQVRASLQTARSAVADVRGSLGDVDVDATLTSLAVAEEELADAERRAARPTWTVMTFAPMVGPTVQVTREVVEVAAAALEVVGTTARQGEALLAEGLDVVVVDGRIDLQPVLAARDLLAELPIQRLEEARAQLAQPTDGWLPVEVLDGREDTLALANETAELLARAEALTAALPGFFGADGPRRYFVGFQTSAELRGTGGLIAYWAVLSVDEGRVSFGSGEDYDPFDDAAPPAGETRTGRIRTIGLSPVDPPDVDPDFRARYGRMAGARSFPNINLDPDLPTAAVAMLDLYELQTGDRLDGVLLLDPAGLQRLLEATGDTLPLPDDLASSFGFPDGLPTEQFSRFVTVDIYDTFGFDASDERNEALRRIGDEAFARVSAGGWDGTRMIAAVAESTARRHLQVYTRDTEAQAAFAAVNATGSLEPAADADLLAVTANNIVGGKQDVHLGHGITANLTLSEMRVGDDGAITARRSGTVEVTVDNPLPSSGLDLYIIGNCIRPDRSYRCFEGVPGENHTWFSVWTPEGTDQEFERGLEGPVRATAATTFRQLRVSDHFVQTPSQDVSAFSLDIDGAVPLIREQRAVVYQLDLWRQSKATPDLIDLRIAPPPRWAIGEVEVVGGGSGRGAGVHGEGVELSAEVEGGSAVVRGTVTADTRVIVRLVDPETVQAAG